MSAVDERTDLETIEHLDFDVRCEVGISTGVRLFGVDIPLTKPQRCEKPATAILRCRSCSVRANVCASHGLAIVGSSSAVCMGCHAMGSGTALYEFIPIKGS